MVSLKHDSSNIPNINSSLIHLSFKNHAQYYLFSIFSFFKLLILLNNIDPSRVKSIKLKDKDSFIFNIDEIFFFLPPLQTCFTMACCKSLVNVYNHQILCSLLVKVGLLNYHNFFHD
jgi:hypothetical protein